jgi:hypothetical protein
VESKIEGTRRLMRYIITERRSQDSTCMQYGLQAGRVVIWASPNESSYLIDNLPDVPLSLSGEVAQPFLTHHTLFRQH